MPVPFPFTTFGANRSSASGCDITAADNMNHWWKMNDGITTATDVGAASVTRRNITWETVTTTSNGNRSGNEDVIALDGTSDSYGKTDAVAAASFGASNLATYSFWIKPTGAFGNYDTVFFCSFNSSWATGIALFWLSNQLRFFTGRYNVSYSYASEPAQDTWSHVACVFDYASSRREIWINGVKGTDGGTIDASGITGNQRFCVGAAIPGQTGSPAYFLDAEISDFRIYDIALSQAQIENIYCEGDGDWP